MQRLIYNSRNFISVGNSLQGYYTIVSTTVEILFQLETYRQNKRVIISTTVEILFQLETSLEQKNPLDLQQ